jgi:glycolate oxidase FAD binding subunit
MRLLAGSWGSLALITELSLRTMPLPPHRAGLLVQGEPKALAELSRALLGSTLSPERIDWWSAPLAHAAGLEDAPALLIALASVEVPSLQEQISAVAGLSGLAGRRLEADEVEALLQEGRGGDPMAAAPAWLLRLGVNPDTAAQVVERSGAAGLKLELGGGSGLGMAWSAQPLDGSSVEALRAHCQERGGHLTVLRQPEGAGLAPWRDAPSKALIEAVKRHFDPKSQLAPGRLPGVAAAQPTAAR